MESMGIPRESMGIPRESLGWESLGNPVSTGLVPDAGMQTSKNGIPGIPMAFCVVIPMGFQSLPGESLGDSRSSVKRIPMAS